MSFFSPGLALAAILATVYGAVFHLWRGGGYDHLARYLLAAWVGFALGQAVGWLIGWPVGLVGQVYVLEGTLGSAICLVLMSWLSLPVPRK